MTAQSTDCGVANQHQGGSDMALAVHSGAEISKIIMWVVAFAAFVVVALTWVPDWVAPQGEQGAPEVGRTVKMIK
jgi:lipopolysaccharide export LptBFGC system permease protein LptF